MCEKNVKPVSNTFKSGKPKRKATMTVKRKCPDDTYM